MFTKINNQDKSIPKIIFILPSQQKLFKKTKFVLFLINESTIDKLNYLCILLVQ